MYVAEIRGKLSSRLEHMEDILTSNVFSFFKYADRKTYFYPFLKDLGFEVSEKEVDEAKFIFWPCYEDKTEPDVVIIVGSYYILFEAKYFSDFGEDQLRREATGGSLAAKNLGKQFYLCTITADYSAPKEKFHDIRKFVNLKWVNWQEITLFLEKKLKKELPDQIFAEDLYLLLKKKNLRMFDGFSNLLRRKRFRESRFSFFDYILAKHRGEFIGFLEAFSYWKKKIEKHKTIFFDTKREFSWAVPKRFTKIDKKIFFGG